MTLCRAARRYVDPLGALIYVTFLAVLLLAGTCSVESRPAERVTESVEPVRLLRETPPGDLYVFEVDDFTCIAWANRGQTGLSCEGGRP